MPQLLNSKELERWHSDFEFTLIHEKMEKKWHLANVTPPLNEFDEILQNSKFCGYELLELLQRRTKSLEEKLESRLLTDPQKQLKNRARIGNLQVIHNHSKNTQQLMRLIDTVITQMACLSLSNFTNQDYPIEKRAADFAQLRDELIILINQAVALTFEASSHVTAYDFNIHNSFHIEQSFNDRVTRPKKGGQAKATGFNLIRQLVQQMGQDLITHFSHTKLKKKDLEAAIAQHLATYAKKGTRREKPEFIHFVGRVPALKTIKNWLMTIKIPTPTVDAQEINIQQLCQQLKNTYPDKVISELLK